MAQTQKKASGKAAASVSLDPSVRSDLAALLSELAAPTMSEHRKELHRQLVALENVEAASPQLLLGEIRKVLGAINQIPKATALDDRPFKARAITLANSALQAHGTPKKLQSTVEQCHLNDRIITAAMGDTISFMRWLQSELTSPTAKDWNTINLATACFNLSRRHNTGSTGAYSRAWYTMGTEAFETARILAEHLTTRSRSESCNAHSSLNICRTLPHIITGLSLGREASGNLDARFIDTLTAIIGASHEKWSSQFIVDMVFNPLSETKSVYLSSQGKEAVCRYAAALHNKISSESDFDMVQGVGDSFRSLRGITCWCHSTETQRSLEATLKLLNDRLENSRGSIDSKGVVTILGGLRGIDYPKLTEPALSEVARTLNLVNAKLGQMTGTLNYQAVGTAINSLGVALEVTSGPIQAATTRLLSSVANKLPEFAPENLVDLGTLCSALYTLNPTDKTYAALKKRLWERVDNTKSGNIDIPFDDTQKVTAWSVINQTFAVYGYRMPASLSKKLASVQVAVDRQIAKTPSTGESLAREVLSCSPEIGLLSTTMLAGFELDIPARRLSDNRPICFEVDGPHHDEPCQRRSDMIRDSCLRKNGIQTIRITGPITDENIIETASRADITIDRAKLAALRSLSTAKA